MRKLDAILTFFEKWCVGLGIGICLVVLTLGVFTRYVFMRPLSWPDEMSTYLFIMFTFMGASASVATDSELKVNALYERLPRWRFGLDLFLHLARMAAAVIIIYTGVLYVQVEYDMDTVSPILSIPLPLIFSMLVVFGIMLAMRTVLRLYELFRGE